MIQATDYGGAMAAYSVRFSPEKLARLLSERNMTPYALAKEIGGTQTWVQKLMAGRIRMPTDKYLAAISEYLEVPVSDLLDVGQEPLALHENGVEYEIAREALPNTDPVRLAELISYWVQMAVADHDEMIDEARKRLPRAEGTGE